MKNKGFTLVELLAVLVLISAIILIVVPSIINYVNESKDNISEATAQILYSGAQLYVDANPDKFSKVEGRQICVTLEEIVALNYLTEPIVDSISGEEIDLETAITITYTYDKNLQYLKPEYDVSDSCKLCTLVNGAFNEVGSKYTCDLGDGDRTFYVLEAGTSSKSATLILYGNYDTMTLAWCDQNGDNPKNNSCHADGLELKLDEIALAWNKLGRSQIGLPSMEQIMVADGRGENDYEGGQLQLSNKFLYSGYPTTDTTTQGYWTSTGSPTNAYYALLLNRYGKTASNYVYANHLYGIRPVIYLDLKQI